MSPPAKPDIVARRIGVEGQPIVVIDRFHPDPDALRTHAGGLVFEPARRSYPGIRAPLPDGYFAQVRPALAPVLREVFGHAAVDLLDASFSIVTTSPDALAIEQRLPHVDAVEPGRVALVHYLSETADGTAFYRHRATAYETIDRARADRYYPVLKAEFAAQGPPPAAYLAGDTPLFERIAAVDARYNRAVVYSSALLHSGSITSGATLDPDPLKGRLTVTAFLQAA